MPTTSYPRDIHEPGHTGHPVSQHANAALKLAKPQCAVAVLADDDNAWLIGRPVAIPLQKHVIGPAPSGKVLRIEVVEADETGTLPQAQLIQLCRLADEGTTSVRIKPLRMEALERNLARRHPPSVIGRKPQGRATEQIEVRLFHPLRIAGLEHRAQRIGTDLQKVTHEPPLPPLGLREVPLQPA